MRVCDPLCVSATAVAVTTGSMLQQPGGRVAGALCVQCVTGPVVRQKMSDPVMMAQDQIAWLLRLLRSTRCVRLSLHASHHHHVTP